MASLLHPVAGARVSSPFGVARANAVHGGADFAAANGTPVVAAAAGRVTSAHYSPTAGNMIIIDHGGGLDTRYFHLSSFAVGVGSHVSQGQMIGRVGSTGRSTGAHLHFEVRVNGAAIDPLYALQNGVAGGASNGGDAGAWLPQLDSPMSMLPSGDEGLMLAGFILLLVVVVARRR